MTLEKIIGKYFKLRKFFALKRIFLIQFAHHIFVIFFIFFPLNTWADVMSSDNYKIFSDVLSVGGAYSTSTNYGVFDTLSEVAVNPTSSSSSNFEIQSGFWGMSSSSILSVSLSTNSISLGTLKASEVSTYAQSLTITTNAFSGYTTTVQTDGALRTSGGLTIPAVSDGSVTAGSEEYGIRTSGTNAQMNSSDTGLSTSAQTLATVSNAIIADSVTITYKASRSNSSLSGDYSQAITFTTTVNF